MLRGSIQLVCDSRCWSAQCHFYKQYVQEIHHRCQALPGKVQPCQPACRVSSINLMGYWFWGLWFHLKGCLWEQRWRGGGWFPVSKQSGDCGTIPAIFCSFSESWSKSLYFVGELDICGCFLFLFHHNDNNWIWRYSSW